MLKGGGKLIGILQTADIGVILRVVGGYHINQRVGRKDVNHSVQTSQKILQGKAGIMESILCGRKSLLLYHLPDPQIGIKRKHPQGKDNEQKINAQKLASELSEDGGPLQPPRKPILHKHASSDTPWVPVRFGG